MTVAGSGDVDLTVADIYRGIPVGMQLADRLVDRIGSRFLSYPFTLPDGHPNQVAEEIVAKVFCCPVKLIAHYRSLFAGSLETLLQGQDTRIRFRAVKIVV